VDEAKVQELMRQMADVERQRQELEGQKKAHEEKVKEEQEKLKQQGNGSNLGAGAAAGAAAAAGADGGYVDWLKKLMMRGAGVGMDEDELNWQFMVDKKQVGIEVDGDDK
jgi:hypothetical protein